MLNFCGHFENDDRVTIRGAILCFQNVQNGCQKRHKKWAVKIQHCPISSKFDMWVDNDQLETYL
jgi:hypothetical protein